MLARLKLLAPALGAIAALALTVPTGAGAALPVHYGSTASGESLFAEIYTPTFVAGANNGCRPSSAHPYPVVLVHATLADEGSNWVSLAPLLADNGYCVYAFNYGETVLSDFGRIDALGNIERSAEELSSFVNHVLSATGAPKVDLVGHSQGGMMPNYYIHFLGGASKVNELIGLAPSNHGTNEDGLVELLQRFPWAQGLASLIEFVGAPSLVQQEFDSSFITKLFGSGEPLAPGVKYVVIETSHDEVVTPYTNAFLHGSNVTDILLQEQCPTDPVAHIGMASDSPALQNVLNWLGSSPSSSFKAKCENFGIAL
ncbi:MAG TPA: alpha/beta fold hydrolase [Solirubrobacteraceae bacterium]|nr:alpha/beta fold hydrolase [Solirubrobacteraceae bacterium]